MKTTSQDILKWTVIGGSTILAVGSLMSVISAAKAADVKAGVMPAIALLVSVSAFSYAMTADKISFKPQGI